MNTFTKILSICFALSTFLACGTEGAPTDKGGSQDDPDLIAVTEVVHNFYKWYENNGDTLSRIDFVKGGKPTTIDDTKLDEYLALLAKSGYIGKTYVDAERAYFKNLEATAWKNENADEEPITGLDYDRFLCSQEIEDFKLLTTAPVTAQGLGTVKITATLEIQEYLPKKFELVKENSKWLIAKIICE